MPSTSPIQQRTHQYLQQMLGSQYDFRPGQWEAIEAAAVQKRRVLIVQRTGWGKSLVYFLATRLLRDEGAGPSLLISPLLSLMRNQIEMADRIGIRAMTINSANREEWQAVNEALANDQVDLLLISPERLNSSHFLDTVLPSISGRIGMFVVDEAHCISDWGHDFRPDYRRIVRIIQALPPGVPVLGTTATANNRVVSDVESQLGPGLVVMRGPLGRDSLRLQTIRIDSQADRLAWLAENLPKFEGSGIVYCLTVADTQRVSKWLQHKGLNARAYHAGDDAQVDRPALEQAFLNNETQVLVATVALGMGFDKPDISFVIHFQCPGSVIAYYQQVGRAGRGVERSYGILLGGVEDVEIQNYFIESAFPSLEVFNAVLRALESAEGLSITQVMARVNATYGNVEKALRLLELDGAVGQEYENRTATYFRTPNPWAPDTARMEQVTRQRRIEQAQMQAYLDHPGCLMEFLLRELDDPSPVPCGRCANCRGKGLPGGVNEELAAEAELFLRQEEVIIEPRVRLPAGIWPEQKRVIPPELRNEPGRALCFYASAGWGRLVSEGKYREGEFSNELVEAVWDLIHTIWQPQPRPEWVTAIPSHRHPQLVPGFAARLAARLGLPFIPALGRSREAPEQKGMQNSFMQARNVIDSLVVTREVPASPVLLVDDIIDSGWTLCVAGFLLRRQGSGPVFPFALARATGRNVD